jgi:hypothetical protein
MPFGYTGQNQPNQTVSNSGVFSITDVAELQSQGKLGGSLEFIAEQTVTSMTSAVDFTDVFTDKYDVYFLETKKVQSNTTGYTVGVQFYESGVLETAGVYQYAFQGLRTTPLFFESRSTTEAWIHIGGDTDTTSANSSNSYTYIYNPTNSSKFTFLTTQSTAQFGTTANMRFGGAVLPQASLVDGFRLRSTYPTGQITGEFILYGVKQL